MGKGSGEDRKVLPWVRVIHTLIPVENSLRDTRMGTPRFGDGDWGNGHGNGVGVGDTDDYQGLRDRGAGDAQYGRRNGNGNCRRI